MFYLIFWTFSVVQCIWGSSQNMVMDTDLDIGELTFEQKELTREARIKDQKREQRWTRFKEHMESLGYIILDSVFVYLNPITHGMFNQR